ncbi:MAG: helix-turn-helix transcriptional regulator [Imperialibacter sp.]|uniref:response regulator transcription factor n=1 Tax=Imperialibacter sp. TaxID=2038411 RepID=UPI0032EDCE18
MTIEGLVFWISFIFCLALTAGGIMVIFRFAKLKALPAFQHLQYFLILLYTFGFYSLWSESFIAFMPFAEQIKPFSKVLTVLGIPFIIFSAAQQMYWSKHVVLKSTHWVIIPSLAVIVSIVAAIQYYALEWTILTSLPNVYAAFGFVASTFCGTLFLTQKTNLLSTRDRLVLTAALFALATFYGFEYMTSTANVMLQAISHFVFFLLNTFIAVYFVYTVKHESVPRTELPSQEAFINRFGLTSRESEIIGEIYSGKTNQEIADTLFVTLQTIKDHTSRIYQKTDVKSRAQLIRLMRDFV